MIQLSAFDLGLAALLVVALALTSLRIYPGMAGQLLIAGARTAIQLTLIGLVLKSLFESASLLWVSLLSLLMLAVAGREVMARQHRRFSGLWGYGLGVVSMFISSFSIALFALLVVVGNEPWYQPQYAIPLLGMLLGNTMNGIALGLDRLTTGAWQQRAVIEARLMLGQGWAEALEDVRRESMRGGMTPMLNAMAAGRPIVACHSAGHPLTQNETGLIVPDNDVEAFAAAILDLLNSPEKRTRLGAAARRAAERLHNPACYADALVKICESVT